MKSTWTRPPEKQQWDFLFQETGDGPPRPTGPCSLSPSTGQQQLTQSKGRRFVSLVEMLTNAENVRVVKQPVD